MRYLTKSRFKLATECPTKLSYTRKKEYADQSSSDKFLMALAEGGYQVGELAKYYFPGGHDIKSLDYKVSLDETNLHLKKDKTIVYEAAVSYKNLFIRIDVLKKNGNVFDLIEVKAKSFSSKESFVNKKNEIKAPWKPYLLDVAFQEYVLKKAFPKAIVRSHLMLADKDALTSIEGLNQKFKLTPTSDGQTAVTINGSVSLDALGDKILTQVNVREYVEILHNAEYDINGKSFTFKSYAEFLAEQYENDSRVPSSVSVSRCSKCQFKTKTNDSEKGLKSGFNECWLEDKGFLSEKLNEPNIFDIWNSRKKQTFLDQGKFLLTDISHEDIGVFEDADYNTDKSTIVRQWLQIDKRNKNDPKPYIDKVGMKEEMKKWVFPLHFIDFETSMVAIPFNKGRRPYEQIAFQYSHHIAYEDGRTEHKGEYINKEQGVFPNFDFVRNLKEELENDNGTIFRYATHENTVLNDIIEQLENAEDEIPDKNELTTWIESITNKSHNGKPIREGVRCMVDMYVLVKNYYYHICMGGSNSIKQVLPAILNSSTYLQNKYSKPIYGAKDGIPSLNFKNWTWIKHDEEGKTIDPYKQLSTALESSKYDCISDGGAAMNAYAKIQFCDIPNDEKDFICQSLLNYCELDTLAMTMIWEEWRELVSD